MLFWLAATKRSFDRNAINDPAKVAANCSTLIYSSKLWFWEINL